MLGRVRIELHKGQFDVVGRRCKQTDKIGFGSLFGGHYIEQSYSERVVCSCAELFHIHTFGANSVEGGQSGRYFYGHISVGLT